MMFWGLNPALVVFLVGVFVSLTMSFVNFKFLGGENARKIKKRIHELRMKMLEAQKSADMKKMNECLKDILKLNSEYMKLSLKPMLVSLLLFALIVPFLNRTYTGTVVATIPQSLPLIGGFKLSWFWWYLICTFVVGWIVRKILGI